MIRFGPFILIGGGIALAAIIVLLGMGGPLGKEVITAGTIITRVDKNLGSTEVNAEQTGNDQLAALAPRTEPVSMPAKPLSSGVCPQYGLTFDPPPAPERAINQHPMEFTGVMTPGTQATRESTSGGLRFSLDAYDTESGQQMKLSVTVMPSVIERADGSSIGTTQDAIKALNEGKYDIRVKGNKKPEGGAFDADIKMVMTPQAKPVDTVVIAAPLAVDAKADPARMSIYVFWNEATLADKQKAPADVGYLVYRQASDKPGFILITPAPVHGKYFADTHAEPDKQYAYQVVQTTSEAKVEGATGVQKLKVMAGGQPAEAEWKVTAAVTSQTTVSIAEPKDIEWACISTRPDMNNPTNPKAEFLTVRLRKWGKIPPAKPGEPTHWFRLSVTITDISSETGKNAVGAKDVRFSDLAKGEIKGAKRDIKFEVMENDALVAVADMAEFLKPLRNSTINLDTGLKWLDQDDKTKELVFEPNVRFKLDEKKAPVPDALPPIPDAVFPAVGG